MMNLTTQSGWIERLSWIRYYCSIMNPTEVRHAP